VIVKNPDGTIAFTESYEWTGKMLTITRRDLTSEILSGSTYEFSGKNISKETHIEFNGTVVTFKQEVIYAEFDSSYNPDYIVEYPFPASLNNYNKATVSNTDYSTGSPNSNTFTFDYMVNINNSQAVVSRERVRDDGQILLRTYAYENCP
jgi:hypothetical protein